jgi:hypothetical protein
MFCQECGTEIRQRARFCNKCGMEVKQRFSGDTPVPKPETPPPSNHGAPQASERVTPVEHPWPHVEHTLVMPLVSKPTPAELPPPNQAPRRRAPGEIRPEPPTVVEPPTPTPAVSEVAPISRDEIPRLDDTPLAPTPRPVIATLRSESARKPFFTQVVPATSNRQHRRLVLIVPLLVVILILVFALAYHAAK